MTREMIGAAQKAWGDGIVNIAAAHTSGGDYVATATDHIDTLYAYEHSPVLFKPTLAAEEQFRSTFIRRCPTSSRTTTRALKTRASRSRVGPQCASRMSTSSPKEAWAW